MDPEGKIWTTLLSWAGRGLSTIGGLASRAYIASVPHIPAATSLAVTAAEIASGIPNPISAELNAIKGAVCTAKEIKNLVPLGLGSTARTLPYNLTEQLAMQEIMSNPQIGRIIKNGLKDSRWNGWSKMSNKTAHEIEIHYNALWQNGLIKAVDDFKFIDKK